MVQNVAAAEAKQALNQNLYFTTVGCLCSCEGLWDPGTAAALECRGGTHDRAGVDVIRVALAVLHLQGDSGVIVCNTKGTIQCVLS